LAGLKSASSGVQFRETSKKEIPMKRKCLFATLAAIVVLLGAPSVASAKRNLADYSLRVHIYSTHWEHNRWGYHAFGRANLFDDKGVPHGVEFTYDCDDHMMASDGNEAYPAKWKKPSQSVEVVFGEIGANPDSLHACEMKVAEKSFVYYKQRGEINTESAQEFITNHKAQIPTFGASTAQDVPASANSH
jgi:hypothetical protein